MLDGVDKVFTLSHIDGRHGPLQCWDLHVGARITALGRHMTLMQASGATLEWLEMRSIQLQKMKRQFVKEVRDVGGGASEWDRGRDRGRVGGGVRFGEARVVELRGGSCSMGGEYGAVVMFVPGRVRVS